MSKEEGIYKIGDINFEGIEVPVYHDKYNEKDTITCSWGTRNPQSFYSGELFIKFETSEVIYPDGAIIPQQTKEDREIVPKFIITESKDLTEQIINQTLAYLDATSKMNNLKYK